jgi:hypothetical protein
MPEAMRLYRENIDLKAQIDTLSRCLTLYQTKDGRKRERHSDVAGRALRPATPALSHGQLWPLQYVGTSLTQMLSHCV